MPTYPLLLISIFSLMFVVSFLYMIKTDVIFGLIYAFLFVYSIFAIIGYTEFPQLSMLLGAYFGAEFVESYIIFIALSFFAFFIFFKILYRKFFGEASYGVYKSRANFGLVFLIIFTLHLIFLYFYFLNYGQDLSYQIASDESIKLERGIVFQLFMHAFKLCPSLILLLYFLCVNYNISGARVGLYHLKFILALEFIIFMVIATRLGNRTDLLALTISIIFLEYYQVFSDVAQRIRFFRRLKYFFLYALVMIILMQYVESTRNIGGELPLEGWEKFLMKDFFAPAHILFAVIALNYIDPLTVFTSNLANSLFMLNQPYLQYNVMELFVPGIASRSASYAFYLFTEGFIVFGWFGFLYNGLIPFLGISLWRFIGNSNSKFYNTLVLSLISTQLATACRGQSSYFIKDIYIFFIPVLILFYLATGLRPKFYGKSGINTH